MTDQLEAGRVGVSDAASETSEPVGAPTAATARRPGWWARRRSRPSKWDRPPDPRDWRFFVGTLGKILIATGLLLFGFVAYQLYGTGIETARAQNKLEDRFEQIVAQQQAERAGDPDRGTSAVVDDEPSTDVDVPAADPSTVPGDATSDDGRTAEELADAAASITTIPPAIDLSDEAVEQDIPAIARGDVLARLEIPRIDQDVYVVPGVRLEDLKDGPGHYPDTPLPGQLGNASIAGHRTTYGAPFFDVDQLVPGDELIVTMITGDQFVYLVTGVEVVTAADYWVVTTQNPDIAELTLTSCDPKYTARDRIVVHSVLDPSRSANVGVPTFYELDEDVPAEPIPGDDPVVSQSEVLGDDVEPVEDPTVVDPGEAADDPAVDPADDPGAGPADDGANDEPPAGDAGADPLAEREVDAFAQGWFDDSAAFPQIALWGLALTAISLFAYAVSRRFRHDSLGVLVGIAPFVVALYFFFQNVNRLLPPGL